MSYERRDVAGGAVATTLVSGISASDTSFTLAATTGWPSGTNGKFFVVIGRGTATEEKVLCTSRTGAVVSLSLANRGADGTSATGHAAGDSVEICGSALDDDEANYTVAETVGKITAQGQVLVADGANSLAAVQGKTAGQVLMGNGTTVVSQALSGDVTMDGSGVTAIGNNKITNAMMADDAVGTAEIADSVTLTTPNIGVATGTSLQVTGNLYSTGGRIGYPGGSGGTVTQATDKSTGVTLNKPTGQITMNNASLAAGAGVSFTLTNSVIQSSDIVIVQHIAVGTQGAYVCSATFTANGSVSITIRNLTGGALAEAIILGFVVIRGSTN